jgi:phosphoribosylamine--glycine ligase
MKVLVVGGGGREHTLVWKIRQSPRVSEVFCAPGNGGMAELATCVGIDAENIPELTKFALAEGVDLTVVGPEGPLSAGIVDAFQAEGLRIFGPNRAAAEIEGSKSFAKSLMLKYGIPTAAGETFTDRERAAEYVRTLGAPLVVKADGLAAGKGVIVCRTEAEALDAIDSMLVKDAFGEAGRTVVVEECLTGEEASFIAFTDGRTVLPLPSSQDHKAVYDNDEGPNTGGMGAYSPAPVVDGFFHRKIMREIMEPTVRAMAAEGRPYKGVLYAGLMIDRDRVKVLEFNARMGDPEAQPLLMRIQSDLAPLLEAVIDGDLDRQRPKIDPRPAVCVVMAAGGYPGDYEKGHPIQGLDAADGRDDRMIFHAGTRADAEKGVVAAGGRVLGVTALGDTIADAIGAAYETVGKISWKDVHFRKDIGQKALRRMDRKPRVLVVMNNDSDLAVMEGAAGVLKKFGVPYEMTVASAHRSPARAAGLAAAAKSRGIRAIIAGAGQSAHLAGALAAHTTLPVIGVPISSSALQGLDALLSTVQMPAEIPVATVALGRAGAVNAGLLAVQMLALSDPELERELEAHKTEMGEDVNRKAAELEQLV